MLAPPTLSPVRSALLALSEPSPICLSPAATTSSCARDAEACFSSFGWSDMPCQGDYLMDSTRGSLVHNAPLLRAIQKATLPPPPPPPPPPSFEDEDENARPIIPASPTSSIQVNLSAYSPKISEKRRRKVKQEKKVSFADALEVRTYELVLGNHPACRGGMALECGWSHSDTEMIDLQVHEAHSRHRRMSELHLSFFDRRTRLQEVTGMTGSELLQLEYELCCEQQKSCGATSEPLILHRAPTMKLPCCQ